MADQKFQNATKRNPDIKLLQFFGVNHNNKAHSFNKLHMSSLCFSAFTAGGQFFMTLSQNPNNYRYATCYFNSTTTNIKGRADFRQFVRISLILT
jgi:hypothetical protein